MDELKVYFYCQFCSKCFWKHEELGQMRCKTHNKSLNIASGRWNCCDKHEDEPGCIQIDHLGPEESLLPLPVTLILQNSMDLNIPPDSIIDSSVCEGKDAHVIRRWKRIGE
jgi:hypothetical protein